MIFIHWKDFDFTWDFMWYFEINGEVQDSHVVWDIVTLSLTLENLCCLRYFEDKHSVFMLWPLIFFSCSAPGCFDQSIPYSSIGETSEAFYCFEWLGDCPGWSHIGGFDCHTGVL
jgi:hypothetical protein